MSTSYTQASNPILITTPFGDDKLLLRTIQGEERISGLFQYHLEMVSQQNDLDFSKIVGKPVTVTFTLSTGDKAYRHGIVGRFVQLGKSARFTSYSATLYPWLWLMTMNSDCQIFQNMTVPDIIKKVFSNLGFSDIKDSLTGSYTAREYCVQYMETSFAFVSRLMEEEGIFYFFTHTASAHTMVLADDASAFAACPGVSTVTMVGTAASSATEALITDCTLEQQVVPEQFKTDDYDFETPSTDLLVTATTQSSDRALYEFPAGYIVKDQAESSATRILNSLEVPAKLLRGSGQCRSFQAGFKFTLAGHSRSDLNTDYILQSLSFRAGQATFYSNSFQAFPTTATFRPQRITPRPRIVGLQTALVVGKSGEEIWTDKYGRIVVQFYWDQLGKKDEKSSCWIRVAQGWAGKQWGAMFLPRIGQEVVVSFIDGNPDRPLVTGCVYNAEQAVPYTLPDDQTKSTIKSNSSKGGNGFNEIRFEDKASSEEIFIQAQKDMNVNVLNNLTTTVTNARSTTVSKADDSLVVDKGNRSIKVNTGNETHEVKGTRDLTITGNETHTDKADFTWKITGNLSIKVDGNITIESSKAVSIKSGTDFKNEAGTTLTNKSGTDLTNQAGTSLTNKAGTPMENNAGISLTNKASASQTVDGGGMLTLKGGLVKIN